VALAKRCRGANIPLPGLGYWAKKDAGKSVIQPELPPRGLGQSGSIEIGRGASYARSYTNEEILRLTLTPPKPFPDGFPEVMERAQQIVGKVRFSPSLAKPHPQVSRLLNDDDKRREKQKTDSFAASFYPPLFDSPFEKRRLRIMNCLFLTIARIGGGASVHGRDGHELQVTIGDERLNIKLGPLKPPPNSYPPKALPATEKMKLELGWYQPPPEVNTLWVDSDGQKLEDQLEEIVVNLVANAEWGYRYGLQRQYDYLVERKHELEECIRKKEEEKAKKQRALLEQVAKERLDKLIADTEAWRMASDIREYVDALISLWTHRADAKTLSNLETWARWAKEQADEIDPLRGKPPKL
jgi:hypothetical protein